MKIPLFICLFVGVFGLNGVAFGDDVETHILILVGPERHAPGTHEVAAGARLMAHSLNHAENLTDIRAEVFYQWPENDGIIEKADTVVFIGDQFPGERLKGSDVILKDLKDMTERGCGMVCVHYATGLAAGDVASDGEHPLLGWTGGYFATRCAHHQSAARIIQTTIEPAVSKDHPIRQGWDTFEIRDEPYTRNWFGKEGLAKGAFSLATIEYPPDHPVTETVAWAIQRKDGGRGAGITMPHFFRNWENDTLRRFIFNTIIWTSKRDVPEGGVQTAQPNLEAFDPVSVDPKK